MWNCIIFDGAVASLGWWKRRLREEVFFLFSSASLRKNLFFRFGLISSSSRIVSFAFQ
jgi:hypothetical protein